MRICLHTSLSAWTRSTIGVLCLSFCVPTSLIRLSVVQESLPVVHRLRLSSSAYVPTNPEWTNLPQETLDFRRTGFSPALRYSCQHSLSYKIQLALQLTFCSYTMLLYHTLRILSFGSKFQPRLSSAQSHSTSELLRTL